MNQKIIKLCKKIKLVITDVDGVLTDGGMYYSDKGEIMKKFNTKDGMGVELLLKNNIKTILMTKENSIIAKKRGKKINAVATYINVKNKEEELDKICKKFNFYNHLILTLEAFSFRNRIIKNFTFTRWKFFEGRESSYLLNKITKKVTPALNLLQKKIRGQRQ